MKKPKGYWDDIENLKKELQPYVEQFNGIPNYGYFKRNGRLDLGAAIYKYGGFEKLSQTLNLPVVMTVVQMKSCKVPIGYWKDWDNVVKELKPIIEEYGTVPSHIIIRKINHSLEHSFTYHGGYKKVREKLGLPKLYENNKTQPYNYWGNFDNLMKVLQPIIEEYGNIPSSLTIDAKYGSGLGAAIERYYGGYRALRKRLGLKENFYSKENTRISIYREIGLEAHGHICYICGFTSEVTVHHRDENKLNNVENNLMVLCPNHHRMVHTGKIKDIEEYKKNYNIHKDKEYEPGKI